MFEDCEAKLEPLASVQKGPLKLDLIGSRQMCIVPGDQLDPWPFAAFLQVTNTGSAAVPISYGEGTLGNRAFRMDRITQRLTDLPPVSAGGSDGGPVDMSRGSIVETSLAPGASAKVVGDPTYILRPINAAVEGESLAGAPVPPEDRWRGRFELEFAFWIKSGDTDITGTLEAPLEVVVKEPDLQ